MYQDLDWNTSDLKLISTDTKVGARCVSVSAAYGVVDASCGDDGLIVAAHDANDYFGANIATSQVEKQVAKRSIRSGWLDSSIVNYSSNDSPEVHNTKTEKALPNVFGDSKMVTDIDGEGRDLLKELSSPQGSEVPSSSLFIHNSTKNLFTQPSVDTFLSVILDSNISGGVRHVESYGGPGARLLTAEGTSFGLLGKTRKSVVLFAGGEWIDMHQGPVSCLRSFAKSKRYKNLICLCDREGLHLKAVITPREIPFYGHPGTRRESSKQDRISFV
ncbi:MAG: hypothetical protein EOO77_27975 [Oxalobacteraceae bacterium]|nr:MAG: hypothetical protein EOO77_27975 [Oxalobacteraceae bacterium]